MPKLLVPVLALAALVVAATSCSLFVTATYINGVGYNLERKILQVPRQPHDIAYPQEDTSTVSLKAVREASVVCDRFVPVLRTVTCELHLYDECGNPFGHDFNVTHDWNVLVQELDNGGLPLDPSLIAPTVWMQKGVGRFYFTPLRVGLHRVALTRRKWPYQADLQLSSNLGASSNGGFIVKVHGVTAKGLSHNFGATNLAVQRMLWTAAKYNAEPSPYPPTMPATFTFEDKKHTFDDRRYGQAQQDVRRPPVQPFQVPPMPDRTARLDDNAHRLVDIVFP